MSGIELDEFNAPQDAESGSGTTQTTAPTKPTIRRTKRRDTIRTISKKYNPWLAFRRHRQKPREVPKKKAPFTLCKTGLTLLLSYELLILIIITVLWVLSETNNGFVDVPDTPSTIEGSHGVHGALLWASSLSWTFLPAFIVSMCGKLFSKTLETIQECQPTIEMRRFAHPDRQAPRKSSAKLTVLLDYGGEWVPFLGTYHAFQNGHFLIGVSMLVKWTFIAIGPLAAAIISVGIVPSSTTVKVRSDTVFDDWRNISSSSSAFESASAILLNGGSPLPWTTKDYSVVPFTAATDAFGNLTARLRTYSASLDCEKIDIDAVLAAKNITVQNEGSGNVTTFSFADRGCAMDWIITITPKPPLFSKTNFAICPLEAGTARVMFMTGEYDTGSPYLLSEFSLLSCVPSFWNSTSRVSVLSGRGTPLEPPGQIIDVAPDKSSIKRFWPQFWEGWLTGLPGYVVQDPTLLSDADDFGRLAYSFALQSNGTRDFAQSLNATFGVLFAAFTTTSMYSPRPEPKIFTGSLARPANRLFVVPLPATIVTVVMAVSFLTSTWIAVFAHRNQDSIKHHLSLILGHAILLENNKGVQEFIEAVRGDMKSKAVLAAGGTSSQTTKSYTEKAAMRTGDLVKYAEDASISKDWTCWIDENGSLTMGKPGTTSEPAEPKATKRKL